MPHAGLPQWPFAWDGSNAAWTSALSSWACNAESDVESPHSPGGTDAASRMASELEDMCALSTTCTRKNPQKNASKPKLVRSVMRSRALLWNVTCAVYVSCIWCDVSENLLRCITLAFCVTLPCCCGVRNTPCTPTKRKPEKCLLAKRCKEMYGEPRKN